MLGDEGGKHLLRFADQRAREEVGRPEAAAAANEHERDTGLGPAGGDRQHVRVCSDTLRGADELLRLQLRQGRELVAQCRGLLELQRFRCPFHLCRQSRGQLGAPALQDHHRRLDVACVLFLADQADAGRRAAADLVLQARPAAGREIAVLAATDPEKLV
jgi:hypothetical protein